MPLDIPDIRYEERDCYLFALVSGEEDSLEVTISYFRDVIDECERRGLEKLLIVEEFPNQLSTMDMYEAIEAISEMVSSPLKIAFVDRHADHDDLNRFGETVGVNRGLNGRVFASTEEAEAWLRS